LLSYWTLDNKAIYSSTLLQNQYKTGRKLLTFSVWIHQRRCIVIWTISEVNRLKNQRLVYRFPATDYHNISETQYMTTQCDDKRYNIGIWPHSSPQSGDSSTQRPTLSSRPGIRSFTWWGLDRDVVLVVLVLAGQTNSATTLDLSLPTFGDKPYCQSL